MSGSDVISVQMVRKWCREFGEGRCEVHSKLRRGCSKVIMHECVNTICVLLNKDRCLTLLELETIMNDNLGDSFSRMSISRIVTEKLWFCKVCARWIPHQLSPEHRTNCMAAALAFWSDANMTVKKCWVGLLQEMRHRCITSLPAPKRSRWFGKNPKNHRQKNSKLFCRQTKRCARFFGMRNGSYGRNTFSRAQPLMQRDTVRR